MTLFNASSTADEVLSDVDVSSRRILITGASSGLGLESARALAAAGAEVIITARNKEKYCRASEEILALHPNAKLHFCELRLDDIESCREAGAALRARFDKLDHIIANAGVMACEEQRTAQGFEWQFGVNHIGHFVFINYVVTLLTEPHCRVAVLSSGAHRYSNVDLDDPNFNSQIYDKWLSYGRAKTANALYAVELNRRMLNGHANAVHPGAIVTNLSRHMQAEDFSVMGAGMKEGGIVMKSIAAGSATQVWAITAPALEGQGGLYLEDCSIGEPSLFDGNGYDPYALNTEAAKKLWEVSEELVGEKFSF